MTTPFDLFDALDNYALILTMDNQNQLVCRYCNSAFHRLFNLDYSEDAYRKAVDILHDLNAVQLKEMVSNSQREKRPLFATLRHEYKNTELHWRVYCQPLAGSDDVLALCSIHHAIPPGPTWPFPRLVHILEEAFHQSAVPAAIVEGKVDGTLSIFRENTPFTEKRELYIQCFEEPGFRQLIFQVPHEGSSKKALCPVRQSATPSAASPATDKPHRAVNHFFLNVQVSPIVCGLPVTLFFVQILSCSESAASYSDLFKELKPWETAVLDLVIMGFPTKHIAQILRVTESAIKKRLTACYRKIGVSSRSELLVACLKPTT